MNTWSSVTKPTVNLLMKTLQPGAERSFSSLDNIMYISYCDFGSFHSFCSVVCRNKMVEYLTDWVMGTSNQAADDDIKCLTRYSSVHNFLPQLR